MTLNLTIATIAGLGVGWIARHYYKAPTFKSDTTRFFQQSGTKLRFYTMPTLIGTLLVSISVLNVSLDVVSTFKAIEEKGQMVGPRDYQLFHIKAMLAALTTWYAFINPAWQRARQKQQESEATRPPLG